jgi:two-component system, cell cycle sensor histidine kinase and response regulator CckA
MPPRAARPYEYTMSQEGSYQRELVLPRFLLECFPEPLVVLNEHAAVVDANRPAKEAFGFDVVALFEQAAKEPAVQEFLGQLRANGNATLELQRPMKKGGVGQFVLKGVQIGGHAVVIARDLTERRTLDEEVRQLRRMQSLGFVTASVIHDFNNLMVPIRCLSELLSKQLQAESSAAALLAEVRFAAERAASLVRDVHVLARARTSAFEPLDLTAVIREMRPLVDRMLGGNVDLELSLEERLGEAVVDRERLENAVLNLIANARDAMPHGGRLTISTANVAFVGGPADDDAASPPGYVALIVEDSGIGMTEEVRARVFDRFYTTKHPGSGSGLGLASVQRFVTESGGLISVHSEPGRGTTVTIHLPRVGRRERPTIPDIQARDTRGDGDETVLVVDRDEPVRRTVKAVLQARGYRVLEASSAENALKAAQDSSPSIDLALVDTALPRTDLARFLEQLGKASRGMSILLMSTEERPKNLPISVIGERFLRKAFSEQELVRAARAALDRKPGRRARSERRAD